MNNYHPKLWGRHGWIFMEYTALGYPDNPTENDKQSYKIFYKSMINTLPCEECKKNYKLHIEETPIDNYLKNSNTLYHWVIVMKNKVNRLQGKSFIDSDKERERKLKQNNTLNARKPCCGQQRGHITEEQRRKNIEELERKRRARKNLLEESKKSREIRKKKRKR